MAEELPAPLVLRDLFASSWRMLRAHPVIGGALGGAVVLSLASTLIGVGAIVAPWFICEIFALQLAILADRPTTRSRAWLRAGLVIFCIVGIVFAATCLAVLGFGPDVSTADSAQAPLPWPDALRRVGLIAGVTALTVGFLAPFSYAPLILIDRGGLIGEALLESAWLVRRGGLAKHWALAFLAQLVPLAPAIVAAGVVARTYDRASTPIGVLVGLTLVPFSVPLGQGLLSAAYFARARELAERRWTRKEGKPPWALRIALIAVVLGPVISVLLLGVTALRPAPLEPGSGSGVLVLEREVDGRAVIYVPDTTLAVRVEGARVEVRAGDGYGTALAIPERAIGRVRVLRREASYEIELSSGGASWVLAVDRAAVRIDDSFDRRIETRLPGWALLPIAIACALTALLLVRALEPLGAMRRAYGAPAQDRAPLSALRAQRRLAIQKAWTICAVLAPASALALAVGIYAVARL